MRLVRTSTIKPGVTLGKSIYNDQGHPLVNEGVLLDERLIKRLLALNIVHVYIDEDETSHIVPVESVPDSIRRGAIRTIETTFQKIQKDISASKAYIIEQTSKDLSLLIRALTTQLRSNKALLNMLSDVFTYDNYIFTHSLNVTLYSLAMGMELKLSNKEMEQLGMGAIMHDVGKIMISEKILLKNGRLTEEEFLEVQKHAEFGFELLRKIHTIPLVVAHCAYQHHERLDGSGYPRGIKGDDILYLGKIIAVADVFDAVTSNRVYRNAMLPHEGLEVLYAGSGTQFDTKIIEAFRRSIAVYPIGLTVDLSDGRKGIVSGQNRGLSERPIIEIIEERGISLQEHYALDLKDALNIVITGCDTSYKADLLEKTL